MGLQVGDVVVRLNDQPVSSLTHGKAHEQILLAGNNFVLGVLRGEESRKAIEAIPQENIVPYTIPLEELPPVYPEEVRQDTPEVEEEVTSTVEYSSETLEYHRVETIEKPIYPDSEEVPNKNLTDDEIALLILEEEELLPDQGVLGVNFKKLRPRAQLLKESKVFEELQNIATAEPPQVQELKRTTTFLQKPQRPVPKAKEEKETEVVEPYKVVIKKQQKKSITERLLEKGLLEPGSIKTPESRSEVKVYVPGCNIRQSNIQADVSEELNITDIDSWCSFVNSSPAMFSKTLGHSWNSFAMGSIPTGSKFCTAGNTRRLYMRNRYFNNVLSSLTKPITAKKSKDSKLYFKGRYLENYLTKDNDSWLSFFKNSATKLYDDFNSCSKPSSTPVPRSMKLQRKGRYLEKYLKKDNWITDTRCRIVKGIKSGVQRFCGLLIGKHEAQRKIYCKPHYLEKVLTENSNTFDDFGHYIRNNVFRRCKRRRTAVVGVPGKKHGLKNKYSRKGRYMERSLEKAQILDSIKRSVTREVFHRGNKRLSISRLCASLENKNQRVELYMREGKLTSDSISLRIFDTYVRVKPELKRTITENLRNTNNWLRTVKTKIDDSVNLRNSPIGEVMTNFLNFTKNLLRTEIFHRGSKRFAKKVQNENTILLTANLSTWDNCFKILKFDSRSISFKISKNKLEPGIFENDNKNSKDKLNDAPADTENRRMSFVPTILYEGLTNKIGIDFTKIFVYAFVPCASIILVYMYK
ncbi:uncharacterized protein LOC107266084 isoform X2 [Cephus cinctus]|nr:uncharacterized protein LOC107266084 isoform X2 [Cephus cinctus]